MAALSPEQPVAVVAGGTGAIGSAIARKLQLLGFHIVAADKDARAVPQGQSFHACDLTKPEDVAALFEFASKSGVIRCVVAAQGILRETPAGHSDLAAVSQVIDVNLKSVAYVCDAAKAHLLPPASIILISSWTATAGRLKNAYAYQATKAGLESLTRTFAVAYGPLGIRVNCVAPGFMAEPMKGEGAELRAQQGGMDSVIKGAPLGRLIEGVDIANAVAFLCSDEARAITGVVLPVDAGYRAL